MAALLTALIIRGYHNVWEASEGEVLFTFHKERQNQLPLNTVEGTSVEKQGRGDGVSCY